MKKSIIALSAFLLLFVLFAAPSQADIMSAEDRAILRTQLESTPIGELDPWDEMESCLPPEDNLNNPTSESVENDTNDSPSTSVIEVIYDILTTVIHVSKL